MIPPKGSITAQEDVGTMPADSIEAILEKFSIIQILWGLRSPSLFQYEMSLKGGLVSNMK